MQNSSLVGIPRKPTWQTSGPARRTSRHIRGTTDASRVGQRAVKGKEALRRVGHGQKDDSTEINEDNVESSKQEGGEDSPKDVESDEEIAEGDEKEEENDEGNEGDNNYPSHTLAVDSEHKGY
jgi:hypothetical protein